MKQHCLRSNQHKFTLQPMVVGGKASPGWTEDLQLFHRGTVAARQLQSEESFRRGQVVRQWTLDPRSQVRILAPEPVFLACDERAGSSCQAPSATIQDMPVLAT